eukprot:TRINITY_DN5604_c0_g1_i1.p2 TRINITY_DN5604_c0_g1~~TRINITY_DN5604_c0_g1_i1.p2  ORF type:complete len:363 (-),score=38.03 TRINITY_DN5604_c0_g1_i1:11-1099(-)
MANCAAISDTCHHVVVPLPLGTIQLPVDIHATIDIHIPNFNLLGHAYTCGVQSTVLGLVQIVIGPTAQTTYHVCVRVVDDSFANSKHHFQITRAILGSIETIGMKIFGLLYGHMKTLMQKAFQALQPMMNISGFLSRAFNVLIVGLRAVLHWLLPDTILDKIQYISTRIFQVDSDNEKKSKDKNTEEAALVVIFMFVIVVYGSIFVSGYIFKVLFRVFTADIFAHSIFSVYGERMFGVLETIRILYKKEPEEIDFMSWGWFFKPDLIHHALGIAITTVFLVMMLLVKFIRFIFVALKWTGKKMIGACRRCRNRKKPDILTHNNTKNDGNYIASTRVNGMVNLNTNPVAAIKTVVTPVKSRRR